MADEIPTKPPHWSQQAWVAWVAKVRKATDEAVSRAIKHPDYQYTEKIRKRKPR